MRRLFIQNLGMIITNSCNLNCDHCMRGEKGQSSMRASVVEATLNQVTAIGNLCICGGEPLLALDVLEYIFSYIMEHKIIVEEVSLTTNGTIYSEKFLQLLEAMNTYIAKYSSRKKPYVSFAISYDAFHLKELKKYDYTIQYVENVRKYSSSPYFLGVRHITKKMFREGNAENLDASLTVPYRPLEVLVTYTGHHGRFDVENGLCGLGPLVTVNVDGILTECDASLEHQESLYNYGNVLTDSILEVFQNRGAEVLSPRKWNRKMKKLLKVYETYEE